MDGFKYINSSAVERHLREVGYKLSSLELAWLIWQSARLTLRERHEAWREIVRTMPDCEVPTDGVCLHTHILDLIKTEEKAIAEFFALSPTSIFVGSAFARNSLSTYDDTPYLSLDLCIENLRDHLGEDVHYFEITKRDPAVGAYRDSMTVTLNSSGEPTAIRVDGCENIFSTLVLDFPVPFKRGDILRRTRVGIPVETDYGFFDRLVYVSRFDGEGEGYEKMTADGYFLHFNRLAYDSASCYMDYEYDRSSVGAEAELLETVSDFLKDKLDPVDFAERYHAAKLERETEIYRNAD